ncbi:MAG: DNA/RNA non-specific endonuclease, partial [Gammaproteobacteria bacterium]
KLEAAVRQLDAREEIYETYVICGPIFDFGTRVETIGTADDNGVSLPVPNAYFKSILTEDKRGNLNMWSFMMPNEESDKPLEAFRVPTTQVERMSGIKLWDRLVGKKIEDEKNGVRGMW